MRPPGPKHRLEMPNPFPHERGVVRLLESPDADRADLARRIVEGTYGRPFIVDDGVVRELYFRREIVQSGMRLDDPWALDFSYTRLAMAFLLFNPDPGRILLLGLGGGSLAKFCHRHLPKAGLTTVEIDADVIALRDEFLVPPDGPGFRVVHDDAARFVAREGGFDAIVLDCFDPEGYSPSVTTRAFFLDAKDALTKRGVLVSNLVGTKEERVAQLDLIRAAFGDNIVLLPDKEDGNLVAFVFRDPNFEPRWRWMAREAPALQARHGLDFPRFARKLERSRKLRYLERTVGEAA
jgi:spermidine synthase